VSVVLENARKLLSGAIWSAVHCPEGKSSMKATKPNGTVFVFPEGYATKI
jgi:hypothetical protein